MNKRIASFCTAAVVMFSAMPAVGLETLTAFAADHHYIELTSSYSYDPDNGLLAVEVEMPRNDGYRSGKFDINWESDAFTLVSVDVEGEYRASNIGEVETEMQPNYYTLTLDTAVSGNEMTGTVATFYFEKSDGYEYTNAYDFTFDNFNFSFVPPEGGGPRVCNVSASPVTVSAKTMYDMRIAADKVNASYVEGAEIRVPVVIDKNNSDGFIAGNFDVSWNKSYLRLKDVEYGDIPAIEPADIPDNNTLDSYRISFGDLLATKNYSITAPKTLATLIFTPLTDANKDLNITIGAADIVDYDVQELNTMTVDGVVHLYRSGVFFDEETGILTLSGNVLASDIKAYKSNPNVKKVVAIPGTLLPSDCSHLFENFTAAKEIDLSKADTSNTTLMSAMFKGCSAMTSLDLSSFDTSNVTNMYAMFLGCSNLVSVDLSSFDTSNVVSMCDMFFHCPKLKQLDLNSFDTDNVTNMNSMFAYCYELKELVLSSDFSTVHVSDGDNMFYNCTALAHKLCLLESIGQAISEDEKNVVRTITLDLGSDATSLKILKQNGEAVQCYNASQIASLKKDGKVVLTYSSPFADSSTLFIMAENSKGEPLIHTVIGGKYNQNGSIFKLSEKKAIPGMVFFTGDKITDCKNKYFHYMYSIDDYSEVVKLEQSQYRVRQPIHSSGDTFDNIELYWNTGSSTKEATLKVKNYYEKTPIAFKIDPVFNSELFGLGTGSSPFVVRAVYDTETKWVPSKAATCTEDGVSAHREGVQSGLRYDYEGKIEGDSSDTVIPAKGHDWSEYTYEWSADNASCTRTRVCKRDPSHVETVTVNTSNETGADGSHYAKAVFTEPKVKVLSLAHTKNIDDSGHSNGGYPLNENDVQTITIPGATKLQVALDYKMGYNAYLNIYQGDTTAAANKKYEYTGVLEDSDSAEFDIGGDTVTFLFHSDSEYGANGVDYGYYAVILADGYDVQTKLVDKTEVIINSVDINGIKTSKTVYAENFTSTDYSVPSATYMDGYTFTGWKVNGTLYTAADAADSAVETLVKGKNNVTVEVVYEKINASYSVSVTGGKMSTGKTSGTVQVSKLVTVKANTVSGKQFSHWTRNGVKVSTNATYSFYMPSENVELTAVFTDTAAEQTGTAIIESVKVNGNKLSFVSVLNVPKNCRFVKGGLVATSDSAVGQNVKAENAEFVKLSSKTTANSKNVKYTWTKSNVTTSWYVRGYLVYKDASGVEHTVYGDCVKADLTGVLNRYQNGSCS